MIEVNNVSKTFGEVRAVDGLSFSARPGGILGLLGPNGAGKSTTIRMIMNILVPDSGQILFDGRPLKEEDKNRIGYLPEERGLYKNIKLGEVLVYFAALKGSPRADAEPRIDRWLERFELMDWKGRKVSELSKGMSQKAQFIAAVGHDPEMIFLDEPFSGLDPVSADLLNKSIMELGREGKTILFSTHVMDQAEKICDSVFIMNRGREVVSGPIDQVKDQYGTRSVALEFTGDGAFIEGLPSVQRVISYPRFVEIELKPGAKPSEILNAVSGRLEVRRFEVLAPSLHKIFVDVVGADAAAAAREEVHHG